MPTATTVPTSVGASGNPSPVLLEACDLTCERGERRLFHQLNLRLAAGAMIQLEGRNGAGKTSLLRLLCGLAQPQDGTVLWRGQDIRRHRLEFLAEVLYLGHHHGVKDFLTPEENLRVTLGLVVSDPAVSIRDALTRVGLADFYDQPAHELSAGQRRRVALARLLVTRATLWVLDEPFTSLDKVGVKMVEAMLQQHLDRGGAAIITTHHPVSMAHHPVEVVTLGR